MIEGAVEGLIQALLWSLAIILLVIGPTYIYGSKFESRFFPVLTEVSVVELESDNENYNVYRLQFDKIRNCEALPNASAWYAVDKNGDETRLSLIVERDSTLKQKDLSKPIGKGLVSDTVWKVFNKDLPNPPVAEKIEMSYSCHWFWDTRYTIELKK